MTRRLGALCVPVVAAQTLAQQHSPRAALELAEELCGLGMLVPTTQWWRETERMVRLLPEQQSHFQLPEVSGLTRISEMIAYSGVTSALARYEGSIAELRRAMEAMHAPWLDTANIARSIGSFAELRAIGHALDAVQPFAESITAALRDDLGDWRLVSAFPSRIFDNPLERVGFYYGLGFKSALTAFPAPAFQQSLDVTGIRAPTAPAVIFEYDGRPQAEPDEPEEEGFARNRTAYDLLLRFETQLRSFIDETMAAAFGPRWPTRRVPADVYQAWQEKQKRAREAGEPTRPLIAYADFGDYIRIIERRDNWRDVFSSVFRRRDDVQESFRRLHPARICTMHARIITLDDELLLQVETRRILKAVGVLP